LSRSGRHRAAPGSARRRGRWRVGRTPIVWGMLVLAAWAWWLPFSIAAWLNRDAKPARVLAAGSSDFASSAYYRNCAAARMAGAAPMDRGDPGYRPGLDSDGDGTACE
jgi:hypothetical protein